MGIEKDRFKKMFPKLAKEMENSETNTSIKSIKVEDETDEEDVSQRFDGYKPDVIDFLCRCDNDQQAEEIIAYLEKRGEIDRKTAEMLRRQLRKKGVRSFGPKKEDAYYLKQAKL